MNQSLNFKVGGRCQWRETGSMCGIDGIVRRRNDGTVLAIGTQDREFGEKEDGCVVAWDDGRVSFAPIWNRRFTAIP